MSETAEHDIAIIGGGMVGASLALALLGGERAPGLPATVTRLRERPARTVLLVEGMAPDSTAHPSFDERTTALGNGSRRIFQGLGVWQNIAPEASAIRTIHVSDAGRFGFARLTAAEHGIEAFGYVAPNRTIGAALWARLAAVPGLTVRAPASAQDWQITPEAVRFQVVGESTGTQQVTAKLVVAADGARSQVREAAGIDASVEDYQQIAVVAPVRTEPPADGTAYERFTAAGPFAVLPLADGSYTVIWSLPPDRAQEVLELPEAQYLAALQKQFGWRAGRFVRAGRRLSYPLKLTRAQSTAGVRTVLVGNAAQALHPVAGQGFNLGLRDAAMLAEVLAGAPDTDPGSPELLARFHGWRAADRKGVTAFTDGLVKVFGSHAPGVGALRDLGLLLFDLSPTAKSALARLSIGFAGPTPRLARGLPLPGPEAGVHEGMVHGS
jgi:2-octaprenyl-6-methoxyphenol hydroxylase